MVAVFGLLAVACTGQQQEAPVRSVASPTASPTPYRASPSAGATAPYRASTDGTSGSPSAAAAPSGGSINWHSRIADAQAAARAQGKLILVGSTKDGCGLCDKFAHTTAPQCWSRLSQVAVPYMYDIQQYDTSVPDNVRVDRTLRANLRGAALMPLVGFLTPDLQWVHGFSGPRSVAEFMGDIESARRIYPVHAAALPSPAPIESAPTAMLNEFGETEWSAPADWPAPEDALGPVAGVSAPAAPATPASRAVEPAPSAAEPVAVAPVEPAPAPAADPAAGWSDPATSAPAAHGIAASPVPYSPPPSAPVPSVAPVATPVAVGSAMSEVDAQSSLHEAYALIQAGKFDEARAGLKRVSKALPNTNVGREADKGAVAIYNARRMATADADQRATLADRARRDLGGSMWAGLFS
jgi:hypothetical protein